MEASIATILAVDGNEPGVAVRLASTELKTKDK